jgi:hypothetical protein
VKQADWHGQIDRGNEHRNANMVLVSAIDLPVQRRCATRPSNRSLRFVSVALLSLW